MALWLVCRVVAGGYSRVGVNFVIRTAVLQPFVRQYPGGPVPDETFTHSHLKHVVGVCHHSGFYEIIKASAPTIRLDATPSDHCFPYLHHTPNFTSDALPDATLLIYPGLGQALNMLEMHTWRLG